MSVMLTTEKASIGVDPTFGNLCDPAAPSASVPIMAVSTAVGLILRWVFPRGVEPGPAVTEGGQG